jgi:bifunctional non-homologous end joining protein LigD
MLPELQTLSGLEDSVIDGELVVVTADGRADFDLLSTRVNGRNTRLTVEHPVTLYAFDLLRQNGRDLCDEPWTARQAILDRLDLPRTTSGVVRTVSYSGDGEAMHRATLSVGPTARSARRRAASTCPVGGCRRGSRRNTEEPPSSGSSDGDRLLRFGPAV